MERAPEQQKGEERPQPEVRERPKYDFPSKEELITAIKMMDGDQKYVVLNLNKCHFDAKEDDVRKAFEEFRFVSVRNYSHGSFEVVFDDKKQAIQFIRNKAKKTILGRKFFIKMGKKREDRSEWVRVGQHHQPRNYWHRKDDRERKGERRERPQKGEKAQQRAQQKLQQRAQQKVQQKAEQKVRQVAAQVSQVKL